MLRKVCTPLAEVTSDVTELRKEGMNKGINRL